MIAQYDFDSHFSIGVDAKHFVAYGYGVFCDFFGEMSILVYCSFFFRPIYLVYFWLLSFFLFLPYVFVVFWIATVCQRHSSQAFSPILQLFSRQGFPEYKGSVSVNSVLPVLAIFVFFLLPFLWELSSFWPLCCASFWTLNILLHFLL